jgi:hypothetical protein
MTRAALVITMLALLALPCASRARQHDARSCLVEVLYSEELPLGPMFYHTVRERLRVTPADQPPFETTVERAIPWQAPPPRQGQRTRVPCESVLAQSASICSEQSNPRQHSAQTGCSRRRIHAGVRLLQATCKTVASCA